MIKRDRLSELNSIATLIFVVGLILYNLSFSGFLGLSVKSWTLIWAISENGIPICLCIALLLPITEITKSIAKYVLIPYFIIRLAYHVSCYLGIYFISRVAWSWIWGIELVIAGIFGLIICGVLIRKSWQKR